MKNTSFLYEVIFFNESCLEEGIWITIELTCAHICSEASQNSSSCSQEWVSEWVSETKGPGLGCWSQLLWLILYSLKVDITASPDYVPIIDTKMTLCTVYSDSYGHKENPSNHPSHPISTWEDATAWRPKGTFICSLIIWVWISTRAQQGPHLANPPFFITTMAKSTWFNQFPPEGIKELLLKMDADWTVQHGCNMKLLS